MALLALTRPTVSNIAVAASFVSMWIRLATVQASTAESPA